MRTTEVISLQNGGATMVASKRTPVINSEDVGRIKEAIDTIKDVTLKLTDVVYGGEDGLISRAARLEEASRVAKEIVDETARYARENEAATRNYRTATTDTLNRIENAINMHHADSNLHTPKGLLLRKDVIASTIVLIVFVILVVPESIKGMELLLKPVGL